jgi:hypothetical protein
MLRYVECCSVGAKSLQHQPMLWQPDGGCRSPRCDGSPLAAQRFGPLHGSLFAFVSACALSLSLTVRHFASIEAAQRVAMRLERILQVLEELG